MIMKTLEKYCKSCTDDTGMRCCSWQPGCAFTCNSTNCVADVSTGSHATRFAAIYPTVRGPHTELPSVRQTELTTPGHFDASTTCAHGQDASYQGSGCITSLHVTALRPCRRWVSGFLCSRETPSLCADVDAAATGVAATDPPNPGWQCVTGALCARPAQKQLDGACSQSAACTNQRSFLPCAIQCDVRSHPLSWVVLASNLA